MATTGVTMDCQEPAGRVHGPPPREKKTACCSHQGGIIGRAESVPELHPLPAARLQSRVGPGVEGVCRIFVFSDWSMMDRV